MKYKRNLYFSRFNYNALFCSDQFHLYSKHIQHMDFTNWKKDICFKTVLKVTVTRQIRIFKLVFKKSDSNPKCFLMKILFNTILCLFFQKIFIGNKQWSNKKKNASWNVVIYLTFWNVINIYANENIRFTKYELYGHVGNWNRLYPGW